MDLEETVPWIVCVSTMTLDQLRNSGGNLLVGIARTLLIVLEILEPLAGLANPGQHRTRLDQEDLALPGERDTASNPVEEPDTMFGFQSRDGRANRGL